MKTTVIHGDLLEQSTDAVVNAWNRNVIPWWLLLPQGVSGAIKRRGGLEPFRELGRSGSIPLGGAVATGPGKLPYRMIIHVAGINMAWRASEQSIRDSVTNASALAESHELRSLAFPVIGSGSGGFREDEALGIIESQLSALPHQLEATVVRFRRPRQGR